MIARKHRRKDNGLEKSFRACSIPRHKTYN